MTLDVGNRVCPLSGLDEPKTEVSCSWTLMFAGVDFLFVVRPTDGKCLCGCRLHRNVFCVVILLVVLDGVFSMGAPS